MTKKVKDAIIEEDNTKASIQPIIAGEDITKVKRDYNRHNYKLNEEDIKDIVLDYYLDRSKAMKDYLIGKYNISESYYYRLVKNKDNNRMIENYINDNKKNFTKKLDVAINKTIQRINTKLESDDDIQLNQLSTTLGILYDKSRLENNLSTSNNEVQINIKIV